MCGPCTRSPACSSAAGVARSAFPALCGSPWSQAPRFEAGTQRCLPPHPSPLHVQTRETLSASAGVRGGFLGPKWALPPTPGGLGAFCSGYFKVPSSTVAFQLGFFF